MLFLFRMHPSPKSRPQSQRRRQGTRRPHVGPRVQTSARPREDTRKWVLIYWGLKSWSTASGRFLPDGALYYYWWRFGPFEVRRYLNLESYGRELIVRDDL